MFCLMPDNSYPRSEINTPTMLTIRQAAGKTDLSYHLLRSLCQENRIVHLKHGAMYLINYEKLIEFLNTNGKEDFE